MNLRVSKDGIYINLDGIPEPLFSKVLGNIKTTDLVMPSNAITLFQIKSANISEGTNESMEIKLGENVEYFIEFQDITKINNKNAFATNGSFPSNKQVFEEVQSILYNI